MPCFFITKLVLTSEKSLKEKKMSSRVTGFAEMQKSATARLEKSAEYYKALGDRRRPRKEDDSIRDSHCGETV